MSASFTPTATDYRATNFRNNRAWTMLTMVSNKNSYGTLTCLAISSVALCLI